MSYEQKDNTGSLFKNDKREKDSHPQATGTALIDGKEYWVSAWTKERQNGDKWQSLSFKVKEPKGSGKRPAPQRQDNPDEDPIPF